MCYAVYVSTDSPEDLSAYNSDLLGFEKLRGPMPGDDVPFLEFPNRWYVGSRSGCSCTFRHLYSVAIGFGKPVRWYEEDPDAIAATQELYAVVSQLLAAGYRVDLVDQWEGARPSDIQVIDVSLDEVPRTAFRLFENHRFRLRKGPVQRRHHGK